MQSLTQPELLLKPFAESGDKNTLPVTNTDAENPQRADLTNGFPAITSEDPDDGGLPPERMDFNALGYLTTSYDYFYQAGGTFTFSTTISTAIGGYPLGARLWFTDANGNSTIVRSTVANNTDNFNDGSATGIGTTWVPEIPALGWNNTWTGSNTFSGSVSLNGTFDASQSVKESVIGWGRPDYSAGVSKAFNTEYTATTDGFISSYVYSCVDSSYKINDNSFYFQAGHGGNIYVGASIFIPVNKGDTYSVLTSGQVGASYVTFYPVKGE